MIKWYKPSEKMPEIGDTVVLFRQYPFNFDIKQIYIEIEEHLEFVKRAKYWANTSEFPFPKEEE